MLLHTPSAQAIALQQTVYVPALRDGFRPSTPPARIRATSSLTKQRFPMSAHTDLLALASSLPDAWRSRIVGKAAGANLKVVRMDGCGYPAESHAFDEALLVLEGQMNLMLDDEVIAVRSGEVYIVPAGLPHAVAEGSHGTLVIFDQDT